MFFQKGVRRFLFNEGTDEDVVRKAREEELPVALDYLEAQLLEQGWICGELSIADISLAAFFRNAVFVRYQVGAGRWPRNWAASPACRAPIGARPPPMPASASPSSAWPR